MKRLHRNIFWIYIIGYLLFLALLVIRSIYIDGGLL